jgi:GH24 family phage-related lysozyme (muramidase)
MQTQYDSQRIKMELLEDAKVLQTLAEEFEKVDNEAIEGFQVIRPFPPQFTDGVSPLLPPNFFKSTSKCGVTFIAFYEDVDKPFYELTEDPAGNCQVGIGHWLHKGPCNADDRARWGKGLTKEQALEQLAEDIITAEEIVKKSVTVKLTQAQFDALVSLAFNLGEVPADVLTAVNAGDFETAGSLMEKYVYGNDDKYYPGLEKRRKGEHNLLENGLYGNEFCDKSFPKPWDNAKRKYEKSPH